jgi:hypothetical protein
MSTVQSHMSTMPNNRKGIDEVEEGDWLLANDPTKLLPFTRTLERSGPKVERLPKEYIGSDQTLYGENFR